MKENLGEILWIKLKTQGQICVGKGVSAVWSQGMLLYE